MFNFIQTLLFTTKCLISLYSTGGEDSWEWRQYFDLTQHNANNPTSFRPRCHNYLRDEFQSFPVWLTELSLWSSWHRTTPSWFLQHGHLNCGVHWLAETILPYCIWVWLWGVFLCIKNVVFHVYNRMMLSNSQVFHLKDDAYFHPDLGWNTSVVGFSLTLQRFSFKYVCLYFLPTGDGTDWQVWLKINFLFQGCLFWFLLWASWFHRQPTLPAVDCSSQLSWWISKHVVLP